MKLRAVIERITYQNGENGYSILKARVKGYDDLVTLVGNMLDVTVGTVLVAEGQWKVNRLYGSQFVVETYEEAMPATLFGLEKYLGSGLVKGIGPKFSKLIVAKFGMDTFDIIEKDCQRLGEGDGIGPKRIKKIHDSWMKQLDIYLHCCHPCQESLYRHRPASCPMVCRQPHHRYRAQHSAQGAAAGQDHSVELYTAKRRESDGYGCRG